MVHSIAADAILILHSAYVIFTVGGELLIVVGSWLRWQWIRHRIFRLIHLTCVLLVALEAALGLLCPLTVWENRLRTLSGEQVEEELGFIARILRNLIFYNFSEAFFLMLYIGFGLLVILTLLLVPMKKRRESRI